MELSQKKKQKSMQEAVKGRIRNPQGRNQYADGRGQGQLAAQPLTIRLEANVDAQLRLIPSKVRSQLIRQWISEGLQNYVE